MKDVRVNPEKAFEQALALLAEANQERAVLRVALEDAEEVIEGLRRQLRAHETPGVPEVIEGDGVPTAPEAPPQT